LKLFCSLRKFLLLAALTLVGILIAGYHPGLEDDAIYLAAIHYRLNPTLFRMDSDFFAVKLKATAFDTAMAGAIRLTHIPVAAMELICHVLVIFAVLTACYRIASRCFEHEHARWCGVLLIAVLLMMPVTGTGLFIVDQYLVPRAIVTALALFEIDAVLQRRYLLALLLAAVSFVFHPVVAAFGVSLCCFLAVPWPLLEAQPLAASLVIPIGFLFDRRPISPALHKAIVLHPYYMLSGWAWYEWLGVLAPILILLWFRRIPPEREARSEGPVLSRLATRTAVYGVFQMAIAFLIMLPPALERMRPLEPMRYLHLLYIVMLLLGGCLIGEYVLGRHAWRWAVLFVPMAVGMFAGQRAMFPASPHLELPGLAPSNPWLQAFEWVRKNTPEDAYFALGPDYMEQPGEDVHGFRALALRSALADQKKDSGMVVTSEALAERWQREIEAQNAGHSDWQHVSTEDLRRLKQHFGVNWAILRLPTSVQLSCPYQNQQLAVCRID
jgi:hypothetical protein